MKRLLILLALSGCAMTPSAPVVQEVKIPVGIPCKITPIEIPVFAVDGLAIGSGLFDQMRALRAERLQRQGYENKLEAAIKSCQ